MYKLRAAKPEDIPQLLKLLLQVNAVHHAGRPDLFRGPTTKYTAEELALLLRDGDSPVFVCEDGAGRVLGHGFCRLQRPANTRLLTEIQTLYIDDICVDAASRRQGVGQALYAYILDYARSRGCYNVTLNVWACNPEALRFYESLGMRVQKTGMETIL